MKMLSRRDNFTLRLYGFLKGPFVPMRISGSKQLSPETLDEHENQMAIARFIVEEMDPKGTYHSWSRHDYQVRRGFARG